MLVVLISFIKSVFSQSHLFRVFAYALLGVIAVTVITFKTMTPATPEKTYVIAITQFVEHPALDEERETIIKTLRAKLEPSKKLSFIYQNAQGNVATAVQIAAQLASRDPKPDIIIAIATPSAQAAAPEAAKHNIPLVFTAVTDPVHAKLVKNLDKQEPDAMVTGVSDALPIRELLEFVRSAVPNLKAVGVVYNPGESNSASQVQEMRGIAEALDMKLVLATATKTADVAAASESLIGRVDAILIPNDNTAAAAIDGAVLVARRNSVPIFAADIDLVDRGVTAAIGYSRQTLGQEAGNMASDIINGKPISQITVKHSHAVQIKQGK